MTPAATLLDDIRAAIEDQFQSSAGFDPGRYVGLQTSMIEADVFQSSAGFDPGRYGAPVGRDLRAILFQSSAGFDPGRYPPG